MMVDNRFRWAPPAAVLAVILFVTFGGWFVAGAIEGSSQEGKAISVRDTVTVKPASGWRLVSWHPVNGMPSALVTRGGANLQLYVVEPFSSDLRALVDEYVERVQTPRLLRLALGDGFTRVRFASGAVGLRYGYEAIAPGAGQTVVGEVTVAQFGPGVGVVFDGWALHGQWLYAHRDINSMIEEAELSR